MGGLSRRQLLGVALRAGGALASGPALLAILGGRCAARTSLGGLGPLGAPDANGLCLPSGFTSRVIAVSGETPLAGGRYLWHRYPDGGAVFPANERGWIYVSNSEVLHGGGVGALRFDRTGALVDAYSLLSGTRLNCAGGPTPWGTWLSCEEYPAGHAWECDPTGATPALRRRALGTFQHEAVAVDPVRRQLYLTEDVPKGGLYRFTPDACPDLASGLLEIAEVVGSDETAPRPLVWHPVPHPDPDVYGGETPTRLQVPQSSSFAGGEGIGWHRGHVYFTTKLDNRVWDVDTRAQTLAIRYDDDTFASPVLTGVDNVMVSPQGDILVAEDPGNLELVALTPDGGIVPLLRVANQPYSEIAGPAFSPDGTRLYFSSQRGPAGGGSTLGITYEVRGPFLG